MLLANYYRLRTRISKQIPIITFVCRMGNIHLSYLPATVGASKIFRHSSALYRRSPVSNAVPLYISMHSAVVQLRLNQLYTMKVILRQTTYRIKLKEKNKLYIISINDNNF